MFSNLMILYYNILRSYQEDKVAKLGNRKKSVDDFEWFVLFKKEEKTKKKITHYNKMINKYDALHLKNCNVDDLPHSKIENYKGR